MNDFACNKMHKLYCTQIEQLISIQKVRPRKKICRALTPLFGNGNGAYGIGKISGVLTKIGIFDIVLMYDISIARLIPILKLTLVYYEKRERKKEV